MRAGERTVRPAAGPLRAAGVRNGVRKEGISRSVPEAIITEEEATVLRGTVPREIARREEVRTVPAITGGIVPRGIARREEVRTVRAITGIITARIVQTITGEIVLRGIVRKEEEATVRADTAIAEGMIVPREAVRITGAVRAEGITLAAR